MISLPLKKGLHTSHSVKYEYLQKRRWKLIHYFLLLRPNYQLEHGTNKKKKNECKICYASFQNLPQWFKLIFLLQGNGQNHENEFLQKKNILRQVPPSTESFRFRDENMWSFKHIFSQPATDCGLLEGKLSTDIVFLVRYTSNDTAIAKNFYPKIFHP